MGLGFRIRAIREARGISQSALAAQAGMSQQALAQIEARDSSRSKFLVPLARALGYTVEQLQELTDGPAYPGAPTASPLPLSEPAPLELYSTPGERQSRLLRLFDELTPPQKAQVLEELETTVKANRIIAAHYRGRPLRHVENERIEHTFGPPPKD